MTHNITTSKSLGFIQSSGKNASFRYTMLEEQTSDVALGTLIKLQPACLSPSAVAITMSCVTWQRRYIRDR